MNPLPDYALDLAAARRLIADDGWAVVVGCTDEGPRATYAYFLLEEGGAPGDFTVIGHFSRADPQARDIAERRPVLLVFDGPHGYISASWYRPDVTRIPSTFNHVSVHLRGTPEPLDGDAAYDVVRRTLEHHERTEPAPHVLEGEAEAFARKLVSGVCAFRLHATHVETKAKLSQDKPAAVVQRILEHLDGDGPHHNPALAAAMRQYARVRAPR